MNNAENWLRLRRDLEIRLEENLMPVSKETFEENEQRIKASFPPSYYSYCLVFGPGHIEYKERFGIAVPGIDERFKMLSYDYLNNLIKNSEYRQQVFRESGESERFERAMIFGYDESGSTHFFDTNERTGENLDEFAVFTFSRRNRISRTADDFWQFVTDHCLEMSTQKTLSEATLKRAFYPANLLMGEDE